jgi:hypothetical protein
VAFESPTQDGNACPIVTFNTFKHGGKKITWNGFAAMQESSPYPALPYYGQKPKPLPSTVYPHTADAEHIRKTRRFNVFHTEFQALPKATGSHPYLAAKFGGLAEPAAAAVDLRRGKDKHGDYLAFALSDTFGRVVGYQRIYDRDIKGRGTNKDFVFLPDAKTGSFCLIGSYSKGKPLFVAEGLATALTVHLATGYPCAVALDAGGLDAVIGGLKAMGYQKIIIAADNDQKNLPKNGNTGLYKAVLAARKHHVRVFLATPIDPPETTPNTDNRPDGLSAPVQVPANNPPCNTDFNDLLTRAGLEAVQAQLKLSSNPCQVQVEKSKLNALVQDLPIMPVGSRKQAQNQLVHEIVNLAPFRPLETTLAEVRRALPDYVAADFSPVAQRYAQKKAAAVKLYRFDEALPICRISDNQAAASMLVDKGGVYLVNWEMGAGKTLLAAAIADEARRHGLKFGYLAHRIALIANACKRLNIDNYEELEGFMIGTVEGMGLCVNSLISPYFRWFFESADVVCLDEIRQVLEHIAAGSVERAHRELIYGILLHIVKTAWLVIACDADIDQKTVDFLKQAGRPLMQINGGKARDNNKTIRYADYLPVWRRAVDTAISGKITLIQCDSIKETEALAQELIAQGLKVLTVNSETRPEPEQAAFLRDPNAYLLKNRPDVVITSPTISSGFSIEAGYFEAHFMLMQGILTPTAIIQTSGRNRPSQEIFIGFKDNHTPPAATAEEIALGDMLAAGRIGIKSDADGKFMGVDYQSSGFDQFNYDIQVQIEQSKADYINKTLLIFEDKGYALEAWEGVADTLTADIERKDGAQAAKYARETAILTAAPIDDREAKRREKANNLHLKDRYELEKHQIMAQLAVPEPDREDVAFWDRGRGMDKVRAFETLQATPDDCIAYDKRQHETVKSVSAMTKASSKNALYALLFTELGIDQQTGRGHFKQSEAVAALRLLQNHNSECVAAKVGNFAFINERYAVRSVGKLLAKMGLKLASGGHHDRTYSLDPKAWAIMQGYVKGRKANGLHTLKLADKSLMGLNNMSGLSVNDGDYQRSESA